MADELELMLMMLARLSKIEQALLALRMDQRAARSATLMLPEAALYLGLRTKSGQPNVSAVRALCRQRSSREVIDHSCLS
jgi:hypothetical protein